MSANAPLAPIPQPAPDRLLGNIRDIDTDAIIQSMMRLARTYGPIYRLDLPGRRVVVVSSRELVDEVCDEARFDKKIHTSLENIRDLAGDGLFTAYTDEPNWGKAHRILMPAFGPMGIRGMFDQMLDIADQMLLRWERFGPGATIDVCDHMTRLTLDTIALCAFDTRLNSFYQNEMHPFVDAMVGALGEAGARGRRPDVANRLMLLSKRRYEADIRQLHEVADRIIAERRRDPEGSEKKDLLGRMLYGRDPETGEGLSDENIRYQLVTFLIAGHETTSGLLSFALHLLLKNPDVLRKTRAIVDEVLGDGYPSQEQLPKLRWVEQVLMETLRLWPTAPAFGLRPLAATVIGGKYAIGADDTVLVLVPSLHRDTTVWGRDVEAFRPERFDRELDAARAPNAWKPFGNGQRACIGRPFAMQEATLVLSMILQRFDLLEDDPSYALQVKETLTLKPDGFFMRAKRRGSGAFRPRAASMSAPQKAMTQTAEHATRPAGPTTPLLVLYGSNTGSAQEFAQRVASGAPARGFEATIAPMDDWAQQLPKEGAVVIITASYEGQPPDNARQFVTALGSARPGEHAGVRYAVFGVGNRQWARTYQAVPMKVDTGLEAAGATRLRARGEADASGDFFGAFDEWYKGMWGDLAAAFGKEARADAGGALTVTVVKEGRSAHLRVGDVATGEVTEVRELVNMSAPDARSKRHVEIALPEGMTYRAGDYLAVLPCNPDVNVERALRRFQLAEDARIVIEKGEGVVTSLPTGYPVSVRDLLDQYVELGQPATRAQVEALAAATQCPPEKKGLEALALDDAYRANVLDKRVSVLDLLELYPACELSFAAFLEMLPPLKARQYSISSSPLWNDRRVTLTVALVDAPARSGQGRFVGVASRFLADAKPGTRLSVAVRPSQERFHPPSDPRVPMIMICAGTGLAPFRGFVQERVMQKDAGQDVATSLLFFGCTHPEVDLLYEEELRAAQAKGGVDVRPAFSARPDGDVSYVQHRVWRDRADVAACFRAGATVYLCGDGLRMAPSVRETLMRIYKEARGASEAEVEAWADEIEREQGRFVADVFA